MDAQVMERRRFRRADLDVSVTIRPVDSEGAMSASPIIAQVRNVGLAGLYCYLKSPCALETGDTVICSLIIPREQVRLFPFARIHSKGWIVRIGPVHSGRRAGESLSTEQLLGLAVAFAPDATALATFE